MVTALVLGDFHRAVITAYMTTVHWLDSGLSNSVALWLLYTCTACALTRYLHNDKCFEIPWS